MARHGQENVKTTCTVYSPNRRLDVAYTRLRLHRCGLGFHEALNLELCKLCAEGDGETFDHIFMYCEAQEEHRRNLEAKLFKLRYITFDTITLLFSYSRLQKTQPKSAKRFEFSKRHVYSARRII